MDEDSHRPMFTPAHSAVFIIGLFVIIAAILGVATGSVTIETLRMKQPTIHDPITIP